MLNIGIVIVNSATVRHCLRVSDKRSRRRPRPNRANSLRAMTRSANSVTVANLNAALFYRQGLCGIILQNARDPLMCGGALRAVLQLSS